MHFKVAVHIVVWLSIFSFFSTKDSLCSAAEPATATFDEEATARAAIQQADVGWWAESMRTKDQRIGWWREARFGCFMHWGVYAVLAGEWRGQAGERLLRAYPAQDADRPGHVPPRSRREIQPGRRSTPTSGPSCSNKAGMRYLIITSKHHDGFAMFDSDVSHYNVVDATPFAPRPDARAARRLPPPRHPLRLLLLAGVRLGRARGRRQRLGISRTRAATS